MESFKHSLPAAGQTSWQLERSFGNNLENVIFCVFFGNNPEFSVQWNSHSSQHGEEGFAPSCGAPWPYLNPPRTPGPITEGTHWCTGSCFGHAALPLPSCAGSKEEYRGWWRRQRQPCRGELGLSKAGWYRLPSPTGVRTQLWNIKCNGKMLMIHYLTCLQGESFSLYWNN